LSIPIGDSRLIVGRLTNGGDARLLARLAADEPPENALLIARMYIEDPQRRRCRHLTHADLNGHDAQPTRDDEVAAWQTPLVAGLGTTFRIRPIPRRGTPSLRWTEQRDSVGGATRPVALRHVVARLESYQPAIDMTHAAMRAHEEPPTSVARLRNELARLLTSPIVLNRGLRERVAQAVEHDGVTMSVLAIRCGRIKRDQRGRQSAETSWLARRVGLAREAGPARPTPWIHSDVLALIARDGLGISPREAELL
jgi:hypothetical protein